MRFSRHRSVDSGVRSSPEARNPSSPRVFSYCPEASEGSKAYSEFALKWVLPPWDFCQNITLNVDSDRQIYIFGGK